MRILILLVLALLAAFPLTAHAQTRSLNNQEVAYTVQPGDTLYDLAALYLIDSVGHGPLQRLNRVANPRRLPVGSTVRMPVELLRWTPELAQIVHFRGDVRLTPETQLRVGGSLGEGAVVRTGRNSFLRLGFSDGSHVTVPSNSQVRIERLRRYRLNEALEQSLVVEAGRTESEAAPRQRPGRFTVRTPVSVSAVRGTQFRVTYSGDTGFATTSVLEGLVGVGAMDDDTPAGDEAGVEANRGLIVSTEGLSSTRPLLDPPALVAPGLVQTEDALSFEIAPVTAAARYRARLALDAGIVEAFAEEETQQNGTTAVFTDPVENGRYFIQLTALSQEGLEGRARTYSVLRVRNTLDGLAAGRDDQTNLRHFRFRWRAQGDGEPRFRFRLWPEGAEDGPPMIDRLSLSTDQITVADLPRGDYVWSVEVVREAFGETVRTVSDAQQLHIGD